MVTVLVKHKVADYNKWREVFDAALEMRKQAGEQSFKVFTTENDGNEVWVMETWENSEKFNAFFSNPDVKSKVQESGVTSDPVIVILDEK